MLNLLTITLFLSLSSFAVGPNHSQQSTSSMDALLQSLNPETQIVVLGEEYHADPDLQAYNAQILKQLKQIDLRFECFFSEFNKSTLPLIENYERNVESYSQTIEHSFIQARHLRNLLPEVIAKTAKENGYRIIPIDVDWNSKDGKRISDTEHEPLNYVRVYIEERNHIMAKNILEYIRFHGCQRAVFLVGAFHIYSRFDDMTVTPVQKLLSNHLSVQTYTVHYGFNNRPKISVHYPFFSMP